MMDNFAKRLSLSGFKIFFIVIYLTTHFIHGLESDGVFKSFELSNLNCPYTISMSSDWLYSGQLVLDSNQNCTVTVKVDHAEDQKLMFYMTSTYDSQQRNTSDAHIQMFEENSVDPSKLITDFHNQMMEGKSQSDVYVSKGRSLTIQILPDGAMNVHNTSISIIFTAFRRVTFPKWCASSEYRCANSRCIFHALSCNGRNPCGDKSDCQISIPAIATLALGGVCASGVLVSLCYIIVKNTKDTFGEEFQRQPTKFSPTKAFGSFKSFTPAIVALTPLQRKWSTK